MDADEQSRQKPRNNKPCMRVGVNKNVGMYRAARVSDRKGLTAKVAQSTAYLMRAGYRSNSDSATGPENDSATRTAFSCGKIPPTLST